MEDPNVHFIARLWREPAPVGIVLEVHDWKLFQPQLVLHVPPDSRPIEDWYEESFLENTTHNPESFLPSDLEICEEPIWFEAIGRFEVSGWGSFDDYDEEMDFLLLRWTVTIEEEDTPVLLPCPCCGGRASHSVGVDEGNGKSPDRVFCTNCFLEAEGTYTPGSAISIWNSRHSIRLGGGIIPSTATTGPEPKLPTEAEMRDIITRLGGALQEIEGWPLRLNHNQLAFIRRAKELAALPSCFSALFFNL